MSQEYWMDQVTSRCFGDGATIRRMPELLLILSALALVEAELSRPQKKYFRLLVMRILDGSELGIWVRPLKTNHLTRDNPFFK